METKKTILISADQQPINSPFGFSTTADEVMKNIRLDGKVAIVTGGYSGIGLETARALHQAGATVILPARNPASVKEIFKDYTSRLEVGSMDLMDPKSIDGFAEKFMSSHRPLHLLINNAGIMASPLTRDARGFESQFSTNHLGHFQLTLRLWDALKRAKGARVVNLSSLGHRFSNIIFDDVNFEKSEYDKWKAYGQSKTANILFSVHLDRLGKALGIRSYAVHPGRIIDTNLKKFLPDEDLKRMGVMDTAGKIDSQSPIRMKSIAQGAATTLFCATSPALNKLGGIYCEDCNIATVLDDHADISKMTHGVLSYAVDQDSARLLWELSCKLTGVTDKQHIS